jgi:hypothetical protein
MVKKNAVGTARSDAVGGIPSASCAVSQPGSKCERASVSGNRPFLQYVTPTDEFSKQCDSNILERFSKQLS